MTIYEVLVANINALGDLKIPAREPEIFQVVNAAINDLTVCCRTIEAEEVKRKKPDEDDIPVINLDEIIDAENAPESSEANADSEERAEE